MKFFHLLALLVSALFLFSSRAQSIDRPMVIEINSSRGELDTHVYFSEQDPIHGTVLIRTPYLALDSYSGKINFWLSRGFHVVVQSVAGTGRSSGEFRYLSADEIDDAKKTLAWISQQPFSNGRVVLYGESYDGFLALAAATTRHPSIKVVVAASAPTDPKRDSFSSGGMIDYELLKYYLDLSSGERMSQRIFKRRISDLYQRNTPFDRYDDLFRVGGIADWDSFVFEAFQLNFVGRGVYEKLNEIIAPVLLMAGELQDQDASDAIHAFVRRKRSFQNPEVRCATKLAIGPWVHGNQLELSQKVAHQFVKDVLSNTLQCQFQHQVEYVSDISSSKRIGSDLYPQVFKKFSTSIQMNQVEFGPLYKKGSVDSRGIIPLPHLCKPWTLVAPGLERPFVRIPIEENIRLAGPIEARIFVVAQTDETVGMSMDIIVGKAKKGWFTLDDRYNMHRTRKRVQGQGNEAVNVDFQSPYLSLELKKGDEIVLSFQRSHDAINRCLNKDILWWMDENHPFEVSFFFEKLTK